MKYKCPCYGYYTFNEKPSGTYDIYPICFWEDDNIQLEDPDFDGGANHVSLNKARRNFLKFGAYEKRRKIYYVKSSNCNSNKSS